MKDFSKFSIAENKRTPKKVKTLDEEVKVAKKAKSPDFNITIKRSASFGHMGRIRIVVTSTRDGYIHATSLGSIKNKKELLKRFVKEYGGMGKIKVIDLTDENS